MPITGLDVGADVGLVGQRTEAAQRLRLEDKLSMVQLHEGAALVGALLRRRKPLHKDTRRHLETEIISCSDYM
jgi:hypothetical protein